MSAAPDTGAWRAELAALPPDELIEIVCDQRGTIVALRGRLEIADGSIRRLNGEVQLLIGRLATANANCLRAIANTFRALALNDRMAERLARDGRR